MPAASGLVQDDEHDDCSHPDTAFLLFDSAVGGCGIAWGDAAICAG